MSALILTLAVFAVLWTLWSFLNWTFELIEQAHRRMREEER